MRFSDKSHQLQKTINLYWFLKGRTFEISNSFKCNCYTYLKADSSYNIIFHVIYSAKHDGSQPKRGGGGRGGEMPYVHDDPCRTWARKLKAGSSESSHFPYELQISCCCRNSTRWCPTVKCHLGSFLLARFASEHLKFPGVLHSMERFPPHVVILVWYPGCSD